MYSVGTIPREHIHRHAERQLPAVCFCLSDAIGRLGATSRTFHQTTGRLRQGDPRLPRHSSGHRHHSNPKSSLALHVPTHVLSQKGRNVEQGVHDPQSNENLHARAPRDDDGLAAVGFCIANLVRSGRPRDPARAIC